MDLRLPVMYPQHAPLSALQDVHPSQQHSANPEPALYHTINMSTSDCCHPSRNDGRECAQQPQRLMVVRNACRHGDGADNARREPDDAVVPGHAA